MKAQSFGVSIVLVTILALASIGGASAETIIEFGGLTADSGPFEITTGSDGALWFVELSSNRIGRITTNGIITEFPIPTADSYPYSITAGPDGHLWFAEFDGNKIGRITTNGAITEFPLPTANSRPYGITTGPDSRLWFAELDGNKIGRITTKGAIREFPLPTANSAPAGITVGPDGNLWFAELDGNKIGRVTLTPQAPMITVFLPIAYKSGGSRHRPDDRTRGLRSPCPGRCCPPAHHRPEQPRNSHP
jgi:streptogramin lyase